jgi:hypothetical protein
MLPTGKSTTETLLLVAEHDGPEMLARIAVMKALNRHVERVLHPSAKLSITEDGL